MATGQISRSRRLVASDLLCCRLVAVDLAGENVEVLRESEGDRSLRPPRKRKCFGKNHKQSSSYQLCKEEKGNTYLDSVFINPNTDKEFFPEKWFLFYNFPFSFSNDDFVKTTVVE
ncbi:uncharacterized protein G2W53_015155 [Senna tora]|uniref:Uncharacterized protein n=1 Tax=Senna tora TaxID=362788 RepID=A0A834WV06_9FABA|nr:uncharacterized protein G2W53_015155 [Senna tora]